MLIGLLTTVVCMYWGALQRGCVGFMHETALQTFGGSAVFPVFVSLSLCPYYRYIWGKCKDLQRQGKVNHVFCLGGVVCIKLSKIGSPIKLFHMNEILDFPLRFKCRELDCNYDSFSVYITKPFIFLLWCCLLNFPADVSTVTFLLLIPLLITVFNCKPGPGLLTRFLFLSCHSMMQLRNDYHTKRMRCELCLIVGKVLIFFIVQLNSNSMSAQFVGISLIKMLIKYKNTEHPINYL